MVISENDKTRTIVIGHKNPDTDSVVSAVSYADFKKLHGTENIYPASAGAFSAKTIFLFDKFKVKLPEILKDVSPKISDIMDSNPVFIKNNDVLLTAVDLVKKHRLYRLPVLNKTGNFIGMISLFELINKLFIGNIDSQDPTYSIMSRKVSTSINLAAKTLNAEMILSFNDNSIETLHIFVAAMSLNRFKEHILKENKPGEIAVVTADRDDIQLLSAKLGIRLMIITSPSPVSKEVIKTAKENKVSILQTNFDSGSSIRRLKFSSPVEYAIQKNTLTFNPMDKLSDIKDIVNSSHEESFAVINNKNKLKGIFKINDIESFNRTKLILVDHNSLDQAVDGAQDVQITEIIDHHNLHYPYTVYPITVLNDIVGSTSTLIAEKYKNTGIRLSGDIAGILMGGVITDTLNLKSPTSTKRDKYILEWLETIANKNASDLSIELFNIGSTIAVESTRKVLISDKKNYSEKKYKFSLSQVEEASFDNFYSKYNQLLNELNSIIKKEKLDLFGLLITNISTENSILLINGKRQILDKLPYKELKPNLYDLPKILSRKKQLLPELLNIIAKL